MGDPAGLTIQASEAIARCDCLVGARRLLQGIPQGPALRYPLTEPGEIVALLRQSAAWERVCLLVSGDVGFYSGARRLREQLEGFEVEQLCGVSAPVYLAARMGIPWEDGAFLSAHGRATPVAGQAAAHAKLFVLADSVRTPQQICAELCDAGLGDASVTVGENLSLEGERLTTGSARELCGGSFAPLSVLCIQYAGYNRRATHGLPDEQFVRGEIPMTKFEVRCVSLAALQLERGQVLYDIGAGTGSVAVEAALRLPEGRVFAVEKRAQAVALLRENRLRHHAGSLQIIEGEAPEALKGLPAPDRAFIGGSSGRLYEIFAALTERNPRVRVVLNAVTLETLQEALRCFSAFGMGEPQVCQLAAARARAVGGVHLMQAQNPVYILSGARP